ncbi:MAG TPA: rhombosortase [Planctomycetota bacterium]|nr:rhombosortase [Planctomycetota bacterium]
MQGVAHGPVPARLKALFALLAVGVVCAGILVGGDRVAHALRYERNALLDGQLWRALTGHLVHLSWRHLAFNMGLGTIAVALFGRDLRWQAALICALGVTAGLFLGSIRVGWYAGLSGVMYGILVNGALNASRRQRLWLAVAGLVVAKLVVDEFRPTPHGADGNAIIVDAHLYGAIAGALAFAILYRPRRTRL